MWIAAWVCRVLCGGRTNRLRRRRDFVSGRGVLRARFSLQLRLLLLSLLVAWALVVVATLVAQSPRLVAQSPLLLLTRPLLF